MKTQSKDYQQPKISGGEQTIILDEKQTAENDQLDPKFEDPNGATEEVSDEKYEPGDDAKIELI